MNIADIFGAVHLNLETGKFEVDAANAADKAGATMGQKLTASLKRSWDSGGALGVGIAAGAMAFNAFGASIQGAVGFMGDAVNAAMEDEASQAKLRTALEANVKGWNGNTDAIEKVLKSRMKLGFSDEEQRASLAVLVAKTGDVTQALEIQGAAMDLARLKGIDLAAASKAIALGMGGQGRALKELGINVKDYASGTEILAAIQEKAAGQAETYANTTAGAMEAMNVQIGEAMESIGYKLLPVVKDLAFFVRDDVVPAVDFFSDALGKLGFVIGVVTNPSGTAIAETYKYEQSMIAAGFAALDERDKIEGAFGATVGLGKAAAAAAPKVDRLADSGDRAKTAFELMGDKFKATWSELSAAAQGAADDIFGPQIRASDKAANEREQAAQRAIIASRKSTAAEKQDAQDRLLALQKEGLGIQIEMAGRGELTKTAYAALISTLQTQAKSGNLEIASSAQVALDKLALLRHAIITLPAVTTTGQRAVGGSPGRASGGPVVAGVLYRVNENHTEFFRSNTDGMVVPLAPAGAIVPQVPQVQGAQVAGRGGTTYQVNVTGLLRAETPDDIGRVLRRTAALGMTS
jgi:hypothetical protein